MLGYYLRHFDTVELNNSFYHLPERKTFESWRHQTPDGFLFAVKASRFLTHMKRLRDPEEPLSRLFSRAAALGRQLGPALYQLPGNFHIDLPRLDEFLRALPRVSSGNQNAAHAFIRKVTSKRGRALLKKAGFGLPAVKKPKRG